MTGDYNFNPDFRKKVLLKQPTEIKIKGKVESLKLGENYSLVVNHKGDLYSWGMNTEG